MVTKIKIKKGEDLCWAALLVDENRELNTGSVTTGLHDEAQQRLLIGHITG
jgi:hypothetical protein